MRHDNSRFSLRPADYLRRAKPLLASEVLCDELAPLQPARKLCRAWLSGLGLALVLLGIAFRLGIGFAAIRLEAATICFSAAGALGALAILPFPYTLRAAVVALVGSGLFALGMHGAGPLAGFVHDASIERDLTRLLALCVLPAALFFRAHYRAYPRARIVLALALLATLPFVTVELNLATDSAAAAIARVAAAASLVAIGCGLLGFMGAATTGAGSASAGFVLVALPTELAAHELLPANRIQPGFLAYPAAAVGTACAAVLVSLGLFQLLAAVLAEDARRLAKKPYATGDRPLEEPRRVS